MEDAPLLTDLIPKRLGTLWVLFILGLASVVCILFLYFKLPEITRACPELVGSPRGNQGATNGSGKTPDQLANLSKKVEMENIAALDVTRRDSLASWLMTFLWGMAAFGSVLVYLICRQKQDYRRLNDIWIWGAVACLFLSLDQVAGLRIFFRDVMIYCTGTQLYGNGNLWWVAIYLIVFGMIGTRILTEIHKDLPACNSLLMAGICFIVSACAELRLLLPGDAVQNAMLCSGTAMTGCLFLVLSIGLYGRQLIISDPASSNMWHPLIWRKVSRQVNPTMYKFRSPQDVYADEYQDGIPHRPSRHTTAAEIRTRNEYRQDEDDLTLADQETIHRRKGRMRKAAKKGTFY